MEDQKPDFLALARWDSRGRDSGYSTGRRYMTDLAFPRVSCSPVEMCAVDSNFPRVSCSPVDMCAVDSNFPRVSGSPVEMRAVDLNFPRLSFPPDELCTE